MARGSLDPITLCYRGPHLFSDISHTVKSDVKEAPRSESTANGEKKRGNFSRRKVPESIWLQLKSPACVFHLATSILRRSTVPLPEPTPPHTHMMSLSFYHYRLQMLQCWARLVPTLVFADLYFGCNDGHRLPADTRNEKIEGKKRGCSERKRGSRDKTSWFLF